MQKDILFKESETAKILGVTVGTLRYWCWKEIGPPFLKLGHLVRYDPLKLEKFLPDSTHKPTGKTKSGK